MFRTDRTRPAQRRPILLAVVALCGIVPTSGEANVASRIASNSSKFAGAFVNWGRDGREHICRFGKNG